MRVMIAVGIVVTLVASYLVGRETRSGDALSQQTDIAKFEWALREADPLDRSYHYHSLLQRLGPENIDEVAEIVKAERVWLSLEDLQNFGLAWAKFDGAGALEWAIAGTQPGRFRQRAAPAMMFGWGFHDPAEARKALRSIDRSALKTDLHEQLVAGWILSDDKAGAAEYIARLSPGSVREKAVSALITELMRQGADAVIGWVESISDDLRGEFKRVAFQKAANAMTIEDPVATVRWVEGRADSPYAAEAWSAIGRRWAEQDPIAAMEWVTGLPDGAARDEAIIAAFSRWEAEATAEAEDWLRSLTPSERLDQAVRVLVRRDSGLAPESAVLWAARIENEERRERILAGVAEAWYLRDREAAEAWLAGSDLSPETRTAIRSSAEKKLEFRKAQRAKARGRG